MKKKRKKVDSKPKLKPGEALSGKIRNAVEHDMLYRDNKYKGLSIIRLFGEKKVKVKGTVEDYVKQDRWLLSYVKAANAVNTDIIYLSEEGIKYADDRVDDLFIRDYETKESEKSYSTYDANYLDPTFNSIVAAQIIRLAIDLQVTSVFIFDHSRAIINLCKILRACGLNVTFVFYSFSRRRTKLELREFLVKHTSIGKEIIKGYDG